jgi:hemerythrin
MNDLVWDRSLSVDVDEVDEDHRRLVELFNVLVHALADGEAADYVEAVLDELISCTVWHFKHEERLMLKYRYEGLSEHREEHEGLIASARELQQKYLQGGREVSSVDVGYLEHWLTGHILSADMKMGTFLAGEM